MFEYCNMALYHIQGGRQAGSEADHVGPYMISQYVLHTVVRGKGTYTLRGKTWEVGAGQSFLLFPFEMLEYMPDPDDPWEYVWVVFNGTEAKHILAYTGFTPDSPISPVLPCEELLPLYETLRPYPGSVAQSYHTIGALYQLLSAFIRLYPNPADAAAAEKQLLNRAMLRIEKDLDKPALSISAIAGELFISRSYLYKLFYAEFGISPMRYLTNLRVKRACDMLTATSASVKSVAASVGYANPLYFSKVFRQCTGMTPSAYRDKFVHKL